MKVLPVVVGLAFLSCIGCLGAVQAKQHTQLELSLEEAIRLALTEGRAAVSARLSRDEQLLSLEREEERYRPKANVGAMVYRDWRGVELTREVSASSEWRVPTGGEFRLMWHRPFANTGFQSGRTELNFSQPLLRGFGTNIDRASLQTARLQDRIAERAFRDQISAIVVSVVYAWRNVSKAERRITIAQDAVDRARAQLEVNRLLVQAEQLAPQDLVQSEAVLADREYALIDSENAYEIAHAELIDVIDVEDDVRVEVTEEAALTQVQPDLDDSLDVAFAQREDWLRVELGVEQASIAKRVASNNRLWDLSLNFSVSRITGSGEKNYVGRLNLTVPVFDRPSRRSLTRAANNLRRAEIARAETRQAIKIEVRRAVDDVVVALRRIDLARAARDLANRKLEVERKKLSQGLSSSFQIGRFENDLVQAANREVDAAVGYRNARTALSRTLGTTLEGWDIELEQVGR